MHKNTLRLRADVPADVIQAGTILRSGGLVAFPTETVYGLGANALDGSAVAAVFAAKQRPTWDPLIVHVAGRDDLSQVAEVPALLSARVARLADAFWPGPLTLLLPRSPNLAAAVTAGGELVGVRVPRSAVAQQLLDAANVPVAAPSANRFGHISPTTANHVLQDLDGLIDAVLDGGPTTLGLESTVLDVQAQPMRIYRPGAISAAAISAVAGPVQVVHGSTAEEALRKTEAPGAAGLPSPGFGLRHYAPHTPLHLVESQAQLAAVCRDRRARVGALLPDGWECSSAAERFTWGPWDRPDILGRHLYAGLRALDAAHLSYIVCPLPEAGDGMRDALRDRLLKAAIPASESSPSERR